jgi:hypothetical protein
MKEIKDIMVTLDQKHEGHTGHHVHQDHHRNVQKRISERIDSDLQNCLFSCGNAFRCRTGRRIRGWILCVTPNMSLLLLPRGAGGNQHPLLVLRGISAADMQLILEFVYTGQGTLQIEELT